MAAKPVPQQIEEAQAMAAARDRALQTPDEVRAAFLQKRYRAAGIELRPVTLGTLWLLEEIEHPLTSDGPMGVREICQALFILADPERAQDALAAGPDEFARQVHALSLTLLPADLPVIGDTLATLVKEGLASVAGGGNPPKAGEASPLPISAPTNTTASAGH